MSSDTNLNQAVHGDPESDFPHSDVEIGDAEDVRHIGDEQLVEAYQVGDESAWNEILRRHRGVVRSTVGAQGFWRNSRVAQTRLDRLAAELRTEATESTTNDTADPAVRAMRPRAIATMTDGAYGPGPEAEVEESVEALTELDRGEQEALALAFGSLPVQWQTALWHHTAEQLAPAETALFVGRPESEVDALVTKASSGLFDAYLRELVDGQSTDEATGVDERCGPVVRLLSGHYRKTLGAADQSRVSSHLSGSAEEPPCSACRRRLMTAVDLHGTLAHAIVPGVTGIGVEKYRELVAAAGPATAAAENEGRRPFFLEAAIVALVAVAGFLLVARPFNSDSDSTASESTQPATESTANEPEASATPTQDPQVGGGGTAPPAGEPVVENTLPPLRPMPTGPRNVIELDFGGADDGPVEGAAFAGVRQAAGPLQVSISSPAPVLAGGSGTIDVAVTNTTDSALDTEFAIRLPEGVRVESATPIAPGAGPSAECVAPEQEGFTTCALSVDAGETEDVTLRFGLESRIVGQFIVAPSLGEEFAVEIDVVEDLATNLVGRGELVMIGNGVVTCDVDADDCVNAQNGVGENLNRFDYPLTFVDVDADPATTNSSSAVLDVGDASVAKALLFWSGDVGEAEVDETQTVRLDAPGFDAVDVTATWLDLGDIDASEYLAFADVSLLVAAAGNGEYTVADIATSDGEGAYGGWSLVIVTEDDALPRRQFLVTRPFAWVAPDFELERTVAVVTGQSLAAQLTVLGFEGEPGFGGEEFRVGAEQVGGGSGFDSSLDGEREPSFANNFGMDIDAYDLVIDAPDGSLDITARSSNDGVRVGVVAVAVDLAEAE